MQLHNRSPINTCTRALPLRIRIQTVPAQLQQYQIITPLPSSIHLHPAVFRMSITMSMSIFQTLAQQQPRSIPIYMSNSMPICMFIPIPCPTSKHSPGSMPNLSIDPHSSCPRIHVGQRSSTLVQQRPKPSPVPSVMCTSSAQCQLTHAKHEGYSYLPRQLRNY